MAVVACNTMTALGIEIAKIRVSFSFSWCKFRCRLGVEYESGKNIGVIATQATIRSGKHERAARAKDEEAIVYSKACPNLVPD